MFGQFFKKLFKKKAVTPASVYGGGSSFVDAYRRLREPTKSDLLKELKNTAWTCATINSAVTAKFPPKLFVKTLKGQPKPKCQTKTLKPTHPLLLQNKGVADVEEVVEHPLATLFRQVNPIHNSFDLWELTELYLETMGCAYWYLNINPFTRAPNEIWILPSHKVKPIKESNSEKLVDWYEYTKGDGATVRYEPETVVTFQFPDPKNPYFGGLSPIRAAYEAIILNGEYNAMRRTIYENIGLPSVLITPGEIIAEDERDRIEEMWNQKFRRGGAGKALVTESNMKVELLSQSMGDLAALAEAKATKEDIANAFQVPMPYLTGETNLANMEAAEKMHGLLAIGPRLRRRDQKINERLVPLFDPSGRLFVQSDDPVEDNRKMELKQQTEDLRFNIRTVNEVRAERGLPPVPWGDAPLKLSKADERAIEEAKDAANKNS